MGFVWRLWRQHVAADQGRRLLGWSALMVLLAGSGTADGADVVALLGKNVDDPAVEALVGPVYQRCVINSVSQLACPLAGVDFALENPDGKKLVIRQVRLYVNIRGAYAPYSGTLPFGLARNDRRDNVLAKLGRPDQSLRDTDIYTSRSPRVVITYHPGDSNPQAGLIRELSLFYYNK